MPASKQQTPADELKRIREQLSPVIAHLNNDYRTAYKRLCQLAEKSVLRTRTTNGQNGHTSPASPRKETATPLGDEVMRRTDEARIELLRAKREGPDAYAAKKREMRKRLRLASASAISAVMAHSSGRFRANFAARVVLRLPEGKQRIAVLKDLATLFGSSYAGVHTLISRASVTKELKG